jgi:urease accessory protein
MLVKEKLGNLKGFNKGFNKEGRTIDIVQLEWHETMKRILHKKSIGGRDVSMKFLKENQQLAQDDVIYADDDLLILIDIKPCDVIVLKPASMYEMACLCYEIGNKHLPLFYEQETLMIPYEAPVYNMLKAGGFEISIEERKLSNQLSTSVTAHLHQGNATSLFSKIIQLTTKSADA